jgi:hypothetical protein
MHEFDVIIGEAVTAAFKQLLSEKHLYQSVDLDLTVIPKVAEGLRHKFVNPVTTSLRGPFPLIPSADEVTRIGMEEATHFWEPAKPTLPGTRPISHAKGGSETKTRWKGPHRDFADAKGATQSTK